jgi:hypothetical protein
MDDCRGRDKLQIQGASTERGQGLSDFSQTSRCRTLGRLAEQLLREHIPDEVRGRVQM